MIDILLFIDSLSDLSKQNKKSYTDGKTLTRVINNSCLELSQYLYSISEINQKAIDLVLPITKKLPLTSNSAGLIQFPNNFDHLLNLEYLKGSNQPIKCQRISINQLGIIQKIPQRKPSLEKDRLLYYFTNGGIHVLPAQEFNFTAYIQDLPAKAEIVYSYDIIDNEPKQIVASKIDIPFNMNAFNLLLYMVMDKLGFSTRDLLSSEYARLGIQKEAVNTAN